MTEPVDDTPDDDGGGTGTPRPGFGPASATDAIRRILEQAEATEVESSGSASRGEAAAGAVVDELALADLERNDIGNAARLIARHGRDLLYVANIGWHVWDGTCWRERAGAAAARKRAHETARAVLEECAAVSRVEDPDAVRARYGTESDRGDRVVELFKWSVSSGDRRRIEAMLAEAAPYIGEEAENLDADPLLLNLANGTLRLEDGCDVLRPHRRTDRQAKVLEVGYDETAACPRFEDFLAEVQPDGEKRAFLQRWAGYSLTGLTGEQLMLFNWGKGANGKSVFCYLLGRVMGPYARRLPFAALRRDERKRGSEATPDLARLAGARLALASEPEKREPLAESVIKDMTGGEPMTVRRLNQDFFEFMPQFKVTVNGNHKPQVSGRDEGIRRRLLLMPWDVQIPEPRRDRSLHTRLFAEEAPGILNWMLDGLRDYYEGGLRVPDAVRAFTEEYFDESDPLGRFIAQCVTAVKGRNLAGRAFYDDYKRWAEAMGERVISMTAFGRAMPERGFAKENVGGHVIYLDVETHDVPEPERKAKVDAWGDPVDDGAPPNVGEF